MANMPMMARHDTIMARYVRKFHQHFLSRLGSDAVETLRATAWQLEEYLEEHGGYKDAEFIRVLQHTVEYVIQKKCGTDWSIKKMKRDLRGRTRGVNQYAKKTMEKKGNPISADLSAAIENRFITPRQATETPPE